MECYIDLDTRFAVVNDRRMKKSERIEAMLDRQQVEMHRIVGVTKRSFQVGFLRMRRYLGWIV